MASKRSSMRLYSKKVSLPGFLILKVHSGGMEASIACLRGLQGNSQFVGSTESSELLGIVVGLLSDDQNSVLTGTDDFGDVVGVVGQADRYRKVGG